MNTDRGVSPVVGLVLMVAVVVVLAAVVGSSFLNVVNEAKDTNERPIPVSDNLLSNGKFESGSTGAWQDGFDVDLPDGGPIRTEEPYEGKYALKMDGTDNFIGQDVTRSIEPNRIYRMCAYSKATDPESNVFIGVQYYDAEDPIGATILEKATYEVEWTSYRQKCVLTDLSGESAKSAEVWAYYDPSGSGTVYVDDVSLVEVKYLADPDRDTDDT